MVNLGQVSQNPSAIDASLFEDKAIDALLEKAWDLRTATTIEAYLQIIEEIDMRSTEADYAIGKLAYLILRSIKYKELNETQQALANLQQAKLLLKSLPSTIWQFRLYVCSSRIYFDLDQTEQALEFALKQLALAQELENDRYTAAAFVSIGRLHSTLNNSDKALAYYSEAEVLFTKVNDQWGIAITLLNKCTLYRELAEYSLCEPLAQKSMDIALKADNIRSICFSHLELGYCAIHKENFAEAKKHFEDGLKLAETLGLENEIIESCLKLALIPDSTTSFGHIHKALKLATSLDDKKLLADCFQASANYYKQQNDFPSAFEAMEKHMELTQEWLEESNKRSLNNAVAVYETEKAQREAEMHRLKTIELKATVAELEALNQKVRELSIRDALTGLFNRRHIEEQVQSMYEQAIRYDKAFSICLLDIDNFKTINDQFSHQIGDTVLQSFANILSAGIRSADVVARYGGEEFIILMPETPLDSGHQLAERLRSDVSEFAWEHLAPNLSVTASFGVSSIPPDLQLLGLEQSNPEKLISIADKRLYIAKNLGRNQVCSSHTPAPT